MSLYRQLWISVVVLTLIVFIGSFTVSLYTAKSYLEQQLYTQSTDNAASLALSMSQQSKDEATTELLVSALFDSGHFRMVRYSDVHGKTIVDRESQTLPDKVPDWFVRAIPIVAQSGTAMVNDGWKQAGSVTVEAHTRYAYQSLWDGSLTLLAWMVMAGLGAGLLASLFFKWLKRPIDQMVDQARAITERRFITVPEPHFMGRLLQALSEDDAAPQGALLIIRLHDLAGLNRRLGREKADSFLQRVAAELAAITTDKTDWLAARLNGADYALLAPGLNADHASNLARSVLDKLDDLYRRGHTDDDHPAWCGLTIYGHAEAPGAVLSRTDTALLRAESDPARLTANLVHFMPGAHTNWHLHALSQTV